MRCLCPSPQPGVSQPATITATTRSPKEALPSQAAQRYIAAPGRECSPTRSPECRPGASDSPGFWGSCSLKRKALAVRVPSDSFKGGTAVVFFMEGSVGAQHPKQLVNTSPPRVKFLSGAPLALLGYFLPSEQELNYS